VVVFIGGTRKPAFRTVEVPTLQNLLLEYIETDYNLGVLIAKLDRVRQKVDDHLDKSTLVPIDIIEELLVLRSNDRAF
jgi:hypothetical protein